MNMTSETSFLELLLTFLLKDKKGGAKTKILYYNPYKTDNNYILALGNSEK